jgi:hypothetical protein
MKKVSDNSKLIVIYIIGCLVGLGFMGLGIWAGFVTGDWPHSLAFDSGGFVVLLVSLVFLASALGVLDRFIDY